jgi:hypothetical protein
MPERDDVAMTPAETYAAVTEQITTGLSEDFELMLHQLARGLLRAEQTPEGLVVKAAKR